MVAKAKTFDCGCHNELTCWHLPPNFVRMRYYFGQRLGVSDFFDEQAYHEGKRRLINRRLHGHGVLCGLLAERFVFPQNAPPGTPTTVLRVERGLALDACGREIVVGADQCVDVNAWFLANRDRPELEGWENSDEPNRLWVGLRYAECPSDPAPAPRDPCSCDAGGCEFGRIRESFELKLLTETERVACSGQSFPSNSALRQSLGQLGAAPSSCADYSAAITQLVSGPCPDAPADSWLCLAMLEVEIDSGQVADITLVDNAIPERASLLSTQVLQSLVLNTLCSAPGGAFVPGPSVSGVAFEGVDGNTTSGRAILNLNLVPDPADPALTIPLEASTFAASQFSLSRFTAGSGWADVAVAAVLESSPARFVVTGNGTLAAGRFRLVLESPVRTPIVDTRMNRLRPSPFVWQFRLEEQDGALALAESLFE
jgi:hypothetical protein